VLIRFDNGAKGSFSVGQVCSGHKNDLRLEVCGSKAAYAWKQEVQNELWVGHRDKANEILQKDPGLIDADVRGYAHLPGGHQESWADAFCNLMRDIYGFIAAGKKPGDAHPPAFATFEDGYRANVVVEAILESATVRHGNIVIPLTVSVGLALFDESDRDVQDVIERADQGLYVAKKTGRNRTFLMPAEDERAARAA